MCSSCQPPWRFFTRLCGPSTQLKTSTFVKILLRKKHPNMTDLSLYHLFVLQRMVHSLLRHECGVLVRAHVQTSVSLDTSDITRSTHALAVHPVVILLQTTSHLHLQVATTEGAGQHQRHSDDSHEKQDGPKIRISGCSSWHANLKCLNCLIILVQGTLRFRPHSLAASGYFQVVTGYK
ncbi:hypothetical protein BGW80DRAFT_140338 [Lactifluus volemus]|nr:hypothetical protein BGW80DRAFT_140338 [Lactifluus volemus]